MKKVAVLFKDGYEEIEALSVVDVLRRANIECLMVGMDQLEVTGNHGITVTMDQVFNETSKEFDMVVLPGGMPGAQNLKEDSRVIQLLQGMAANDKWIAAICAAPIVLQEAGIVKNKRVTCFPSFASTIVDAVIEDSLVVVDQKIITSKGPATALLFAYTIVESLGGNSSILQESMQYYQLLEKSKSSRR